MVSTDPISDMLTRIRNAILISKTQVEMPYSSIKFQVATILKENNFLDNVSEKGEGINRKIVIDINSDNTNARITEIARVSKPGRRKYVKADQVPTVKRGRGIVIVSTSKGLMTGTEARKTNIGGELICEVY